MKTKLKLKMFIVCLLLNLTAYSQITGISKDQKQELVKALTNYETLKINNAALENKIYFNEVELKLRLQEINLLDLTIDNKDSIIDNQSDIIELQNIELNKNKWLKPSIFGVGIGLIIGLIIG